MTRVGAGAPLRGCHEPHGAWQRGRPGQTTRRFARSC